VDISPAPPVQPESKDVTLKSNVNKQCEHRVSKMVDSIFYDGFLLLIFIFLNYSQCDRPRHCGYLRPQPGSNSATLNDSYGTKKWMRQNERKVRIIFASIFHKHFRLPIFLINLVLHDSPLHVILCLLSNGRISSAAPPTCMQQSTISLCNFHGLFDAKQFDT
jgi:hypothetical protein